MPATDLKATARSLGEQIATVKTEAKAAKANADAMLATAVKEGTVGTKDFNDKYEAALEPYTEKQDQLDELDRSYKSIIAQLGEGNLEQGVQTLTAGQKAAKMGFGERYTKSEAYAELKEQLKGLADNSPMGNSKSFEIASIAETKTLLTSADGSAGDLVVPERRAGIIGLPQADLSLLDLVAVTGTSSDIVEFIVETTRTSAAAEVAEDTAAAESELVFDTVQMPVREIGHFIPATRRILQDAPRLQSWIESFLIDGVRRRVQTQIIAGDGQGENLKGILNVAGINSQAIGTLSLPDAILKAITKVRIAGQGQFAPTVIGIHPTDYEAARLTRAGKVSLANADGTAFSTVDTGDYLLGPVTSGAVPTIHGLFPVVHVGFPQGNPLIGDFGLAELAIRSGVAVTMSDSHADYFVKRKVAMMATMRAAFGTNFPKAFCELTA